MITSLSFHHEHEHVFISTSSGRTRINQSSAVNQSINHHSNELNCIALQIECCHPIRSDPILSDQAVQSIEVCIETSEEWRPEKAKACSSMTSYLRAEQSYIFEGSVDC
eukprot:1139094_1